MPRQPRLVLPGVAVHVIQRGNDRKACFRGDSDFLAYLAHLRELTDKLGCAVHAYCLMTNHVHLLLTPSIPEQCTALMRDLGQRYVQYFNRAHSRTGTLWEGRFRSCIAESARYVLACYRYIESNPVRAGMVQSARDYRWSSHLANAGARLDPLVTPHPEFSALAADDDGRRSAYMRLFEGDLATTELDEIRKATNGGYPLASEGLLQRVALLSKRRLRKVPGGRPRKLEHAIK